MESSARVLRPLLSTRLACPAAAALYIALIAFLGAAGALPSGPAFTVYCVLSIALVVWMGVRGPLLAVQLGATSMRVVGLFFSTEIPRSAIISDEGAASLPVVWWTGANGRRRTAFITAFWPASEWTAAARSHARKSLEAIRTWVGGEHAAH